MQGFEKTDFDSYFSLVDDFQKNNPLLRGITKEVRGINYTIDDIDAYINNLVELDNKTHELNYIKNIKIYPSIKNIFTFSRGIEPWRQTRIRKFLTERLEKSQVEEVISYTQESTANRHSPVSSYFYKLTKEFNDYLHSDPNKTIQDKKLLQQKIKKYIELCAEISNLIESTKTDLYIPSFYFSGTRSGRERMPDKIGSIPIEKNSATLSEKIFARNMIELNYRFYGKPRLSSVLEIMCLPFFKNQFDPSTISRINKKVQEQNMAIFAARKAWAKRTL